MAREMKDSGIAWIGKIPTSWAISRIKNEFLNLDNLREPISAEKRDNKLGLYDYYGASGVIDKIDQYNVDDTVLLIGEDGANLRMRNLPLIYRASGKFWVNNHAHILKVKPDNDYSYMAYLLEAGDYSVYITGAAQPKLSQFNLMNFQIVVPSVSEQTIIAKRLDTQCAEIDAVLEKTRTSIEEYRKLKQAIITQAVTRGVRGDRPMKESGIEWANAIPEEIKVSRLGLHYDIILGKMLCSTQVDDTYTLEPYYCAADVHFEGISDSERKMMWYNPPEKELYLVKKHDLLVVEGGAGAGGCAIVADGETPTYIQNSIMIVRTKHSGDCRYVRYWLECLVRQGYIDVVCNKATIPHFTKDKLSDVPYFVFSEEERTEIADYLDEQCKEISVIIQKKEQFQHEVESYKKSLIYEYVTGKKEVDNIDRI